jgi:hypothetical protein
MTARDWCIGALVGVVAVIGCLVSSKVVNDRFSRAADAAGDRAPGICITLGGQTLRWDFPNAPFAALRCEKSTGGPRD